MTNSNRRKKDHLSKIKINGSWALEEAKIKQGVSRAFQQPLLDEKDWHPPSMG